MSTAVPIIRQGGEGERLSFAGGGVFTLKATGKETGGSLLILEDQMVRGKVTPLHRHPGMDEAIYLLDGQVVVHMDGEEHRVGPGGFFFAPRGLPHAFMVTSDTARILALMTPASGEGFYRAASDPVSPGEDAADRADFDRLRRAAESSDSIELLGPPPFASATEPEAARTG